MPRDAARCPAMSRNIASGALLAGYNHIIAPRASQTWRRASSHEAGRVARATERTTLATHFFLVLMAAAASNRRRFD